MASSNFWTDAKYQPMQQFRYDVQTNLWNANASLPPYRPTSVQRPGVDRIAISNYRNLYEIPKELIKGVNLPDTTVSYDNDAANIGSGGPSIESQDPQITELELQFYMTPELMSNIKGIFTTYYLQNIEQLNSSGIEFTGDIPRIINKDRISLKPSALLLQNSEITINIYSTNNNKLAKPSDKNLNLVRSIKYYGVYPISYNLGNLDYSSPDVVTGNMKFYFHDYNIIDGGDDTNNTTMNQVVASLINKNKCMGNYK